jgi:hypothetical protein
VNIWPDTESPGGCHSNIEGRRDADVMPRALAASSLRSSFQDTARGSIAWGSGDPEWQTGTLVGTAARLWETNQTPRGTAPVRVAKTTRRRSPRLEQARQKGTPAQWAGVLRYGVSMPPSGGRRERARGRRRALERRCGGAGQQRSRRAGGCRRRAACGHGRDEGNREDDPSKHEHLLCVGQPVTPAGLSGGRSRGPVLTLSSRRQRPRWRPAARALQRCHKGGVDRGVQRRCEHRDTSVIRVCPRDACGRDWQIAMLRFATSHHHTGAASSTYSEPESDDQARTHRRGPARQ